VNVNYNGYEGGTTVFRDFGVYNGKNTNILFVDGSAGNVGIGTTGPNDKLEVAGGTTGRVLITDGGGASRKALILEQPGYAGNAYARIESYDYGASSVKPLAINALGGFVGVGGYTSGTAALAINGNVGIGTTTPSEKLDVNGNLRIENQGQLKFSELRVNGNHIATLSATSSMVADINWTLPAVKGEAGQVLMTNGLGNLDWTTISGGTGTGNVGTSTTPTRGQIPYWTTSGANLELLGSVATGTIACSGTVSCSTTGLSVIGGNLSIIGSGLTSYDSWTHPSAGISATTSLIQLFGQASSTLLSANWLQIGGSATTTIDTAGKILTNNATSTLFSATTAWISNLIGTITGTGTWDLSGATVKQHLYPSFSYATSTAWTGTTTIYLAPSYQAETWNGVKCETNTGTLNVSFYDGTNRMNMLNASTTIGTFTLSTNNSFTAGESRRVDIGNPASSPTKISCSVDKTIN
jgi:prepilin-type processing-associated H-X9-DG protein